MCEQSRTLELDYPLEILAWRLDPFPSRRDVFVPLFFVSSLLTILTTDVFFYPSYGLSILFCEAEFELQ